MDALVTMLADGDELTMPASLREALGVKPGDVVSIERHGDELRIRPELDALRRLQARLAPYRPKPGEPYVSDELIAERHAEAERE